MAIAQVRRVNESKFFGFISHCNTIPNVLLHFLITGQVNFRVLAETKAGFYEVESNAKSH